MFYLVAQASGSLSGSLSVGLQLTKNQNDSPQSLCIVHLSPSRTYLLNALCCAVYHFFYSVPDADTVKAGSTQKDGKVQETACTEDLIHPAAIYSQLEHRQVMIHSHFQGADLTLVVFNRTTDFSFNLE